MTVTNVTRFHKSHLGVWYAWNGCMCVCAGLYRISSIGRGEL